MDVKRKYLKIAVTGGIGSGKSTVCEILREEGYSVFSCDAIYARMIASKEFAMALEILFPGVTSGGKIDKKKLSSVVFSGDGYALSKLNAFTHPLIMQNLFAETDKSVESAKALKTGKVVFAEVPLLFEEGYESLFDYVIVVERSEAERIKSVVVRDGCDEKAVRNRMSAQFDYAKADCFEGKENVFVLRNDCKKNELRERIDRLIENL